MSDTLDKERQRIRERKAQQLRQRLEGGPMNGRNEAPADVPDTPIPIESDDHLDEVVRTYNLVLVDCHADWCGPCRMLEPTIEALAAETDAAVVTVDVDQHQHLAQQLGARGVPTLVLYANGEPVEREVGAKPRDALVRMIEKHAA